jgi:hypothetical protein
VPRRRLAAWAATLLVVTGCGLPTLAAGVGEVSFDPPMLLSHCTALRAAGLPPMLRRAGVTGRRCLVRPELRIFVLSSDPTSWPAVQEDRGPVRSLEDPVARRLWVPGAGPVGVSFRDSRLVVARDAGGRPRAAYYAGLADRLDGTGSLDVFVVFRIYFGPCLLTVATSEAEARQVVADEESACRSAVDGG